jgi:hypothetical protein
MKKNGFTYAVVVDADGHFVSALRWEDGQAAPKVNAKGAPKMTLVYDDAAVKGAAENGKWDSKSGRWRFPTKMHYVVNERGTLIGGSKQWVSRLKPLGPTEEYVTVEPPKSRGRRPVWTGAEWAFPRRVGLVNASGVLEVVQLENPRDDQPDVDLPEGYSRIDDRDWPARADGAPVGIGDVLIDGAWKKGGADVQP